MGSRPKRRALDGYYRVLAGRFVLAIKHHQIKKIIRYKPNIRVLRIARRINVLQSFPSTQKLLYFRGGRYGKRTARVLKLFHRCEEERVLNSGLEIEVDLILSAGLLRSYR